MTSHMGTGLWEEVPCTGAVRAGMVQCMLEHAYQRVPGQARKKLAFSAAAHSLQPARGVRIRVANRMAVRLARRLNRS
jgi:hypothetical protein